MSKYKLRIILETESGEIVNESKKEINVRDNNFSDIELEVYRLKKEIMPELEGEILTLEQDEYKKNKKF